jgi:hypothetical protein
VGKMHEKPRGPELLLARFLELGWGDWFIRALDSNNKLYFSKIVV